MVDQNAQIPNWKLALPTIEQVGIEAGLILSLAKTKQLTLMEIKF
jgi:hypothetical protein